MDEKISLEVAEETVRNFLDYYDIDVSDFKNKTQQDALETALIKIRKAVRKGLLEIKEENDSLVIYQHLKKEIKGVDNPIRYRELDGRSKIAMKDNESDDHYGRIYSLLGVLCGEGKIIFQNMRSVDLSVAECLGSVFLNV